MAEGDNYPAGYTEPGAPNRQLDYEEAGYQEGGEEVARERVALAGTLAEALATETTLAAVKTAVEALDLDADSLSTEATLLLVRTAVEAVQAAVEGTLTVSEASPLDLSALATEATLSAIRTASEQTELTNPGDDFKRLLKFEPIAGEEIRRDETATDDYHGIATDGTATSAASWNVVRFYKSGGLIVRVRYRTGVAWDARASGW